MCVVFGVSRAVVVAGRVAGFDVVVAGVALAGLQIHLMHPSFSFSTGRNSKPLRLAFLAHFLAHFFGLTTLHTAPVVVGDAEVVDARVVDARDVVSVWQTL